MVEAIPQVLEAVPQARFVFIGAARSDQKSEYWCSLLHQAGGNRVEMLGFLSQAEMLDWYHKADIAVVPSLNYESFSYTCAQAMAAGMPVVASRIGGIPETLNFGEFGKLVEMGDTKALSDAKPQEKPEGQPGISCFLVFLYIFFSLYLIYEQK